MKYLNTARTVKVTALCIIIFISSGLSSAEKNKVTIAIAANLIPAMGEIEKKFETDNPDIDLEVIPGSSGKITTQIMNGAPFDIFASADMEFPEKLKSRGLTAAGPEIYAEGFLVIFTVKDIDLSGGITAVKDKQVKKISIANPDTAPYGKAAVDALKKAGLYGEAEKNLVYAGNVSQAAQYVITGADMGFVARSLMYDPSMSRYREKINWVTVSEKYSPSLKQGIVLLSKGEKNRDAVKVYRYILSKKAKAVFKKYGYR